jgi:hypothetical protein
VTVQNIEPSNVVKPTEAATINDMFRDVYERHDRLKHWVTALIISLTFFGVLHWQTFQALTAQKQAFREQTNALLQMAGAVQLLDKKDLPLCRMPTEPVYRGGSLHMRQIP